MNTDAILSEVIKILSDKDASATEKYDRLVEIGPYVAALDQLSQGRIRNALVQGGWTKTDAKEFLSDCVKSLRGGDAPRAVVTDRAHTWPYDVDGGRLVLLSEKTNPGGDVEISATALADFSAVITEEGTTEDGKKVYTLSGNTVRSGSFTAEIDAEDFSDDRKLKAVLEAAAGARDPVRAGMMKHLGPAIKLFTNGDLRQTRRYTRTGWEGKRFLLPGREESDVTIRLPRKLPYGVSAEADLAKGLEALDALIRFMGAEKGMIILSHLLLAPLAHVVEWRNERTGVFIKGRTGTHKSSVAQVFMCLYGPAFMEDDRLIKWGEGATRNAIMTYATAAHDLPFLVDNYKPTTGGGSHDFTNLIHNIMEGGDKERLTRAATLRDTKPIHTWPLFTGEDVPNNDPASIARILIIASEKREETELLSKTQELASHLCAVGDAWISWLETDEGRQKAKEIAAEFSSARQDWYERIKKLDSKTVNPMRVATNLATNWLTGMIAAECPTLNELIGRHAAAHTDGLEALVKDMVKFTTQSLEGNRYMDALRELIGSGRGILIRDRSISPATLHDQRDRDRCIGWEDGAGIYLMPEVTMALLVRAVGLDLGNISKQTLYDQLDELGVLASKGKDKTTKMIKVQGKSIRTLHLRTDALFVVDSSSEDDSID